MTVNASPGPASLMARSCTESVVLGLRPVSVSGLVVAIQVAPLVEYSNPVASDSMYEKVIVASV